MGYVAYMSYLDYINMQDMRSLSTTGYRLGSVRKQDQMRSKAIHFAKCVLGLGLGVCFRVRGVF